jgi:hypothetical protein
VTTFGQRNFFVALFKKGRVKMKSATSSETQTAKDDVNVMEEKSFWARFCQKHGVNSNLVMLKVTLFVMHGGN